MDKGYFRNFLVRPRTKLNRRATQQRWSSEMHRVERIDGNLVVDEKGRSYPIKEVLPVDESSTELQPLPGMTRLKEIQATQVSDLRGELIN